MTVLRKFLLVIPLVVLVIIVTWSAAVASVSSVVSSRVSVIEKTENGFARDDYIVRNGSIMFLTGVILGGLVVLELLLVIDVVMRKVRSKEELEKEYLDEQQRDVFRGMLLGKLDSLLDRYTVMANATRETGSRPDKLLPRSNRR